MGLNKGQTNNPNGRPKGSKNKISVEVKEFIESLINDNRNSLKEEFNKLTGRDKIKAMVDLLPYIVPKLQSTSLDLDFERLTDEQLDEIIERLKASVNGQ